MLLLAQITIKLNQFTDVRPSYLGEALFRESWRCSCAKCAKRTAATRDEKKDWNCASKKKMIWIFVHFLLETERPTRLCVKIRWILLRGVVQMLFASLSSTPSPQSLFAADISGRLHSASNQPPGSGRKAQKNLFAALRSPHSGTETHFVTQTELKSSFGAGGGRTRIGVSADLRRAVRKKTRCAFVVGIKIK